MTAVAVVSGQDLGMASRDGFSKGVKVRLAKRVAYRCSAAGCRKPTVGPSDSQVSGASLVGKAAHICAAAPGGARYKAAMTPAERKAEANGIWLCSLHADAVDADETRYEEELLHQWKRRAEELARLEMLQVEQNPDDRHLLLLERDVAAGNEPGAVHVLVDEFVTDVGGVEEWGEDAAHAARLALNEYALNAFQHGGAPAVTLVSTANGLSVRAPHTGFAMDDLLQRGRGGHDISKEIRDYQPTLALAFRECDNGLAEWSVLDVVGRGGAWPCGATVDELMNTPDSVIQSVDGCPEVHFFPPTLWAMSDLQPFVGLVVKHFADRRVVLHEVPLGAPQRRVLAERLNNIEFR